MNISKELVIALIIALLVFGPSRIGQLGAALGKTIRDFRKSMEDPDDRTAQSKPTDSTTPH